MSHWGESCINTRITSDKERAFALANMTISVDDIADQETDIEISRREFAEGKGIPLDVASRNMLAAIHEHAERRCALGQYPAQT